MIIHTTNRSVGSYIRLVVTAGAASLVTSFVLAAGVERTGVERTADSETASLMEWPSQGAPNDYHMCCGEPESYRYLADDSANGGPSSARGGNYFLKLTRTDTQPPAWANGVNANRVEVTTAGDFVERQGEERWYGMSIWVPSWVDTSDVTSWNSIGQWHGSSGGDPGLLHMKHDHNDNFVIETRSAAEPLPDTEWWLYATKITHYSAPMPKDQWIDLVFNYKFDNSENGFLKIWMNGNQIVNYSGPFGFAHPIGSKVAYVKLGSYAGDNHEYTRTYYYDEVRWGNASASYESVSPAGASDPSDENLEPKPPTLLVQ